MATERATAHRTAETGYVPMTVDRAAWCSELDVASQGFQQGGSAG